MRTIRTSGLATCLLACSLVSFHSVQARDLEQLDILGDQYPRAFFFRASEQAWSERRFPTYESWSSEFNRLQGIIGKCLDEECIGREPRNPEFFSRFKREHPNQVVLLHFNGNARDPRYHTEKYFPGHWVYRKATGIVRDVPAESGETVIHVEDAGDFRVQTGRYRTSNDDIALFGITADGRHDWDACEQVQLVSVDLRASTITVKRGCYGTQPRAFPANRSRAAAHRVEGPWGQTNNLMWYYNFTTHCPRDRNGKTCADLLVEDLADWFGPDGKLAAFDGLEFDVMFHETHGDTTGDGIEDNGHVDGVNHYGIGMVEFARKLRERMSDNFILQGDGALGAGGSRSQRAWGLLNGIESEGWPNLREWEMDDWSGGLNRHFFWRDNARQPVFNYVNHKWIQAVPGKPGVTVHPQVPFSRHRMVFAVCQFFDAMTCYAFAPPKDPDGRFGIWDELRCGRDNQLGWLGRPEGPAVRLATKAPNQLSAAGRGEALAKHIQGPVRTQLTPGGVQISSLDPQAENLRFSISGVPTQGSELLITCGLSGVPMEGYPREIARFARVAISGGMLDLLAGDPPQTGMGLRGADGEMPLDTAAGATVQRGPREIAGETKPAVFTHPPYRNGTGYTFWSKEVDVPADSELRFSIGMGEKSPSRSDGVCFRILAADVSEGPAADERVLFEQTTNRHAWLPQVVPLRALGGKRVRLKFVADCGPQDNATTDHAHWGDVRILRSGAVDADITPYKDYMTWVNDRPFESSFYFRDVRSEKVDVLFWVEAAEPVTIRTIAAYPHPDAIYRVFQGGLVLANPSLKPYTFNLAEISPNSSFRRIQGVATQDPETNDGRAVGKTVTLGPLDALFLVRAR